MSNEVSNTRIFEVTIPIKTYEIYEVEARSPEEAIAQVKEGNYFEMRHSDDAIEIGDHTAEDISS